MGVASHRAGRWQRLRATGAALRGAATGIWSNPHQPRATCDATTRVRDGHTSATARRWKPKQATEGYAATLSNAITRAQQIGRGNTRRPRRLMHDRARRSNRSILHAEDAASRVLGNSPPRAPDRSAPSCSCILALTYSVGVAGLDDTTMQNLQPRGSVLTPRSAAKAPIN